MPALISPLTGNTLRATSAHVLEGAGERWPVFDGIPFLRAGRRALADAALAAIDRGDVARAGAILLTDQDPFAPDAPPSVDDNLALLRDEPMLTFRDAMRRLHLGRVADYFAHRWSDPTFLSGLVLATAFTSAPVLELACGAGHYLPELERLGLSPIGADLVFAKLWLCRRFIAPAATLLCLDAEANWPLGRDVLGGVFCHDAFYFLPAKARVVAEMRRCSAADGVIAIGHAHNAGAANHSAGHPLTPSGYANLLGDCAMFDDAALTASFLSGTAPDAAPQDVLAHVDAVTFVSPASAPLRSERLQAKSSAGAVSLNPLYRRDQDGQVRIAWPSPRYEAEYAPLATYPAVWTGTEATEQAIRQRVFVDLPARW